MKPRQASLALGAVAIVAAVLAGYYWVHKPVSPHQALALARTAANLGVAALVTGLAGAIGRRLRLGRGAAAPASVRPGEQAALDVALGWGVGGLTLLGLGLARLYYGWLVWALAGLALVVLRREAIAWVRSVADAVDDIRLPDRPARLAAVFVIGTLGMALLRALAPPVMWDALVYHLTLPKLYVQSNSLRLAPADFSLFTGMPQLSEMLYTAAGLLRGGLADEGAIAAQTLGWAFGAVLVLGVIGLAQEMALPGMWAGAVLLSSFTVALSLAWAYGDLLLVLLALAMLLALRRWRDEQQRGWLVLAGVYGGLAWGCKYTGVLVPLAGAATAAALSLERPGQGRRLAAAGRAAVVVGSAAGLVFSPWLIKNWIFTGSPVYPLLWPAGDMDALRQWFYSRPDLAERSPSALLIFWRATFFGVQGGERYDVTLGPLLLLLPTLLLLGWGALAAASRRELWPLLVFTGVGYLGWVALTLYSALAAQARLFFAILPTLAIMGAGGLAAARALDSPTLRLSMVLNGTLGFVLALCGLESAFHLIGQNPLDYLAGRQSASDYRADTLGWYEPALQQVNDLPAQSRVIFLWETRSLSCGEHLTCVPDVAIDRWWHLRRTVGGADAIVAGWLAEGATHVLIYDAGAKFVAEDPRAPFEPSDWGELDRLRGQLRSVADLGSIYHLYALP